MVMTDRNLVEQIAKLDQKGIIETTITTYLAIIGTYEEFLKHAIRDIHGTVGIDSDFEYAERMLRSAMEFKARSCPLQAYYYAIVCEQPGKREVGFLVSSIRLPTGLSRLAYSYLELSMPITEEEFEKAVTGNAKIFGANWA